MSKAFFYFFSQWISRHANFVLSFHWLIDWINFWISWDDTLSWEETWFSGWINMDALKFFTHVPSLYFQFDQFQCQICWRKNLKGNCVQLNCGDYSAGKVCNQRWQNIGRGKRELRIFWQLASHLSSDISDNQANWPYPVKMSLSYMIAFRICGNHTIV